MFLILILVLITGNFVQANELKIKGAFVNAFVQADLDWRVIDGEDAIAHEFPSIVSLTMLDNLHYCGGTVLNADTVLTAAHCLFSFKYFSQSAINYYRLKVILGQHDQTQSSGKERSIAVKKIILHPAYLSSWSYILGNDIAVIKLASPIVEEDHIKFVQLPPQGQDPASPGDVVQVVGWGSMSKSGQSTPGGITLQKANMNILSNDNCAKVFNDVRNNDNNICAGSGRDSRGACKGDSGGPLYHGSNRNYVQVGVVSYGKVPCGQAHTPTVFTRVSTYTNWIKQNM